MGSACGAALLPGCELAAAPLIVGVSVWPGYEPMILAKSLGWIDETQIRFVETASATQSMELLAQGTIDAAGLTLDEVLRARERGVDLAVVLVCDISAGADVFLTRAGIKQLKDIKGARVGVEENAAGALMLGEVLKAAGLQRSDITVVPLASNDHRRAWIDGQVDAIATFEPSAGHILALGANTLFDSRAIPDLIVDVLAVRMSVLTSAYAPALRQLVATHLKALRYLDTHPGDASYRIAPRFNVAPADALGLFRGLVLPDAANNRRLLAGPQPALNKSIAAIAASLQDAGILKTTPQSVSLLVADYLPEQE